MIFNIFQHKVVILHHEHLLRKDFNFIQIRILLFYCKNRFRAPQYKLASVKKEIYNPKIPTIRHMERDEVLCRLPDEHCRHTTPFTEGLVFLQMNSFFVKILI